MTISNYLELLTLLSCANDTVNECLSDLVLDESTVHSVGDAETRLRRNMFRWQQDLQELVLYMDENGLAFEWIASIQGTPM